MFFGEQGVVQIMDNDQIAIVFSQGDACDNCGLKAVCAPGKESLRMLTLPDPMGLKQGQRVQIEEKRDLELHLASIQSGIPMLLFIIGLLLGYSINLPGLGPELSGFVIACVALAGSFFLARRMVQRINKNIFEKFLAIKPV